MLRIKRSQLTKYPDTMFANMFIYEPRFLDVQKTPKYEIIHEINGL